ncbi:YLP motif-containing protein 1-like [Frankliniella occidentalis]|uniref:YLP motif-containing protein 1-like n=1 Tax=Frankliniella occidentalis TaxID=133901 RepID=A0A9C6XQZ3_FRAOC|nr:YLP motif-containing protein 1-like [Frankliniella occidentalis]XP_052127887.1 YLP motif-containing protein 1-like [Frankliniella occidentalis]XP_052127888.1 YLP motif-containing protein 1-like [Frankliniella occidentalis]
MSSFNHMPYLHVPPPLVRPAMGSLEAPPIPPPMVRPAMGSLEAPPIPPPMVRPAMGSLEAPPIVPSHLQGNVYSIEQQQDNYLYNMMACASEMAVKKVCVIDEIYVTHLRSPY